MTGQGRNWLRWPLRVVALSYLALLIAIPVGSVFYRAFEHGFVAAWDAITTPEATHALWLTLLVLLIAVPLDTAFGVGLALLLSRKRFPGAWLLDALVDVPLAVSPVIVGLALVLAYGRTGWFDTLLAGWGMQVIFSWPGIVMASATVALPYVLRSVLPVLQELGTEQEQAASTLGAGHWAIFRRITFPSIRHGLAYGVTLTTARVLGEFGAVAIVSGNVSGRTQTLTLFISDSVENLTMVGAYAGAVILAVIALGVLTVLGRDHHRPASARGTAGPPFDETPDEVPGTTLLAPELVGAGAPAGGAGERSAATRREHP